VGASLKTQSINSVVIAGVANKGRSAIAANLLCRHVGSFLQHCGVVHCRSVCSATPGGLPLGCVLLSWSWAQASASVCGCCWQISTVLQLRIPCRSGEVELF
jgi:hypothetical protein